MSVLDIILLLPILFGLIYGIVKGLVTQLTSIVAVVAGVIAAKIWAADLAPKLHQLIAWDNDVLLAIAYFLIFIGVALTIHLIGLLFKKLFQKINLGIIDRLIGGIFGAAKWLLIVSLFLMLFDLLDSHVHILNTEARKTSVLYEPIRKVAGIAWDAVDKQ